MKKIILIASVIFCTQATFAQTEKAQNLAKEYSTLLASGENQIAIMRQSLEPMFTGEKLNKIMIDIEKELPSLNEIIEKEIAKTYTEEELETLVKFYKTPIGQSIIKKQNQYQLQTMEIGQKWSMEKVVPIIEKHMQ